MPGFLNAVVFTPSAGGTGDWTVSAAVTGWRTPAQASAVNGETYRYRAWSADQTQWEIGTGTYNTTGPVLARTTVLASSNGGAKVNFTAAPSVAITMFADDFIGGSAPSITDPVITGAITEDIYTITDGAAFEIDPSNGSMQFVTLGASRTPKGTNFGNGESVTLHIADGTAYTITWTDATFGGSGVSWVGGSAPTLATTGYSVVELWKAGGQVYGAYVGDVA